MSLLPIKWSSSWRFRCSRYCSLANTLNSRPLLRFLPRFRVIAWEHRRFYFDIFTTGLNLRDYCDVSNRSKNEQSEHEGAFLAVGTVRENGAESTRLGLKRNHKIGRTGKRFSASPGKFIFARGVCVILFFFVFPEVCATILSCHPTADNVRSTRGREIAERNNWMLENDEDNDDNDDDGNTIVLFSFFFLFTIMTTNDIESSILLFLFFSILCRI